MSVLSLISVQTQRAGIRLRTVQFSLTDYSFSPVRLCGPMSCTEHGTASRLAIEASPRQPLTSSADENGYADPNLPIEWVILDPLKAATDQNEFIAIHQAKPHTHCVLPHLTVQRHMIGTFPVNS